MSPINISDFRHIAGSSSADMLYARAGLRVSDHAESTSGGWRFSALSQNEDRDAIKSNQNPWKMGKKHPRPSFNTHQVKIRVRCWGWTFDQSFAGISSPDLACSCFTRWIYIETPVMWLLSVMTGAHLVQCLLLVLYLSSSFLHLDSAARSDT